MAKRRAHVFFLLAFFLCAYAAHSESLPHGYGNVHFGMDIDSVKDVLKKTAEFGYHGERDVSLLHGENRVLIETDTRDGRVVSFLERCWFQFYDDKLYVITINMDKEKIDRYSVFKTLCEKYGPPSSLSPEKSLWEDDEVRMSLERPLTLKYIDMNVFNEIQKQSLVDKTISEQNRDDFLGDL